MVKLKKGYAYCVQCRKAVKVKGASEKKMCNGGKRLKWRNDHFRNRLRNDIAGLYLGSMDAMGSAPKGRFASPVRIAG